jgi:hypothetical protein
VNRPGFDGGSITWRFGPRDDGHYGKGIAPWVDAKTGRAHVWSVPKRTLWRLMSEYTYGGKYLAYSGARGHWSR